MRGAVVGIAALVMLGQGPGADPARPKPETVTKTGKVVTLAEALKSVGVPADPEPIAKQVVLVEADGTITPLLSDEASRGLFLDERLRDRKAELTARKFPGLPYLQVVQFKVEDGGSLRIPEYWCDVCAISVRYPQICPCCQGPMELRMKPEGR